MPDKLYEAPDTPPAHQSNTVATPEGDNEFTPDEPLTPLPPDSEQDPRGSAPDPYKQETRD